jgi:hypothetical protein
MSLKRLFISSGSSLALLVLVNLSSLWTWFRPFFMLTINSHRNLWEFLLS